MAARMDERRGNGKGGWQELKSGGEDKERKGEVTTASKKNSGRTTQPNEQTKEIREYPITTLIVHFPD
jgi:hypothetical protein